jgi:hypothetical protein
VIACLRAAKFVYPDDSAAIHVELRRHHDIRKNSVSKSNRRFVVVKRYSRVDGQPMVRKGFSTYPEAVRYWDVQVAMLTDQGLRRHDDQIIGFREEG